MAKSKLTKFRLPPAKILRFNPAGKATPYVPDQTDKDREIVASVIPRSAHAFAPAELANLAAVFVEQGWAKAAQ